MSFLEAGQRPFFLEGRYSDRILNIIEKTIFTDIPFFLPSLQKNHLNALSSIVNYISESTIPTINIQTLCNQWEIGKDKVYELLNVLQATGILNVIHNTHSPKGSSKGDKIFFQDCSFYSVLEGNLGSRREAYFTSVLRTVRAAGLDVITSKNEEDGDFVVSDILFELGGKGKSKKRAHVVVKETLDDIYHDQWPLWAFGFLW